MADGLRGHRRGCPVVGVLVSVRPVWVTQAQRELLHEAITRYGLVGLQPLLSSWDKAPADSISAHALVLYSLNTQSDLTWDELKGWQRDAWLAESFDYLHSLGYPDD